MPLNNEQRKILREAIIGYNFPRIYYDFKVGIEVKANTMKEVEYVIGEQLRSVHSDAVIHGLANILYWGYANVGFRDVRVDNLIKNITVEHVLSFQKLLQNGRCPTLAEIKNIRIPQYSGMSFVSKILMFLNPVEYCVLDKQIARLRTHNGLKSLSNLLFRTNETQIRISAHNEGVYNGWRAECCAISGEYFEDEYRVVDIERGFFQLIQQWQLPYAQAIYNAA